MYILPSFSMCWLITPDTSLESVTKDLRKGFVHQTSVMRLQGTSGSHPREYEASVQYRKKRRVCGTEVLQVYREEKGGRSEWANFLQIEWNMGKDSVAQISSLNSGYHEQESTSAHYATAPATSNHLVDSFCPLFVVFLIHTFHLSTTYASS